MKVVVNTIFRFQFLWFAQYFGDFDDYTFSDHLIAFSYGCATSKMKTPIDMVSDSAVLSEMMILIDVVSFLTTRFPFSYDHLDQMLQYLQPSLSGFYIRSITEVL